MDRSPMVPPRSSPGPFPHGCQPQPRTATGSPEICEQPPYRTQVVVTGAVLQHRIHVSARNRTLLFIVAAMLTLTALGAAIGFWVSERQDTSDAAPASSTDPRWVDVLGLTCSVVGLVLIIVGSVQLWRTKQFGGRWRAPTAALTRAQRRDLRRQVLGRAPVQPARLPLLRDLAQRMTKQRPLIVGLTGVLFTQVGGAVDSPSRWRVAFVIAIGVLYTVVGVQIMRDARRAQKFLATQENSA